MLQAQFYAVDLSDTAYEKVRPLDRRDMSIVPFLLYHQEYLPVGLK